uniref:Gamma-secretase subunit PEN-2 n=1 Tax=Quercus lobata TaxID=97700 RepID=A0A7N2MS56_QUELO
METQTNNSNPNPILNGNSITGSLPVWPTVDGSLGLSEDESVKYARRFYRFGFAMLPWLWAVNCFYFWPVLRHSRSFPHIRPSDLSDLEFGSFTLCKIECGVLTRVGGRQTAEVATEVEERGKRDVVGSAVGFAVFTALLSSWAFTFAIGGERLFGPVWDQLVLYKLADKLDLTGWS